MTTTATTSRSARGRAVAVLTAALLALTLNPSHPASAQDSRASYGGTASVRVGTYNIRAGVSTDAYTAGVRAVLPDVDLLALQEINSNEKEAVLAGLANEGWSYFRDDEPVKKPKPGQGQTPVVWRTDRFALAGAWNEVISPPMSVGGESPYYREDAPHYLTVVRLIDRLTGQHLSVINVHLIQGAVQGGERWPGRPRHFQIFVLQMRTLRDITLRERAAWGTPIVLGDVNVGWKQDHAHRNRKLPFRRFKSIGMVSNWASLPTLPARGTHRHSLIDQVYVDVQAASSVIRRDVTYSDHFPVVTTYLL